jgi:hypothetical protein
MTGTHSRAGWRRIHRLLVEQGAWAPVLVFLVHLPLDYGLHAYRRWPPIDIPMHLAGGVSVAFFVLRSLQSIRPAGGMPLRSTALERLLIVGATASVAVLWELAEIASDMYLGTQLVRGTGDTAKDLAIGIGGALGVVAVDALRGGAARRAARPQEGRAA